MGIFGNNSDEDQNKNEGQESTENQGAESNNSADNSGVETTGVVGGQPEATREAEGNQGVTNRTFYLYRELDPKNYYRLRNGQLVRSPILAGSKADERNAEDEHVVGSEEVGEHYDAIVEKLKREYQANPDNGEVA